MKNKTLWIARDKSGALFLYESKPERNISLECWQAKNKVEHIYKINTKLNLDLSWKDNPVKISFKKI